MATLLKQSTNRNVMVVMIDSTDHETGKTGLTLTITASKDGGSFASITPTVTERGNGNYNLALTTAHSDTLGDFVLHITGTGADPYDEKFQVVADLPGATVARVAGAVGSVTGSVGSVTGAVGTVTGDVGGNLIGNVNGTVTLSAAGLLAIFRTTLTESYAAKGAVPTLEQFIHHVMSRIYYERRTASGTGLEWLKLDGATVAATGTLDDATNPSLLTRAT